MNDVYIVEAVRTPIGDFLGGLSPLSAVDLGVVVTNELLKRSEVQPEEVDEIVAGMIYKAGAKGNPARQIQMAAGMPAESISCTVDQQCGSGMRAIDILTQQIMLGRTSVGVALGTESMSNAPYVLPGARKGLRMGDAKLIDTITHDGLTCAMMNYHMGMTAENLAERYGITREEQDKLAMTSHERALKAQENGAFQAEIVPVDIETRKGTVTISKDEHPKATDMEKLGRLKPAFKAEGGTVTAGNASGINDGAAALLLMGEQAVAQFGLRPKARIRSVASAGVAPEVMGIGPVYALPKALGYAGLSMDQIDYFEINEAFAAQFLACNRELGLDMEKVNANGSGIGLGHPVGCTGVRIVVSLLHEMERRGACYGAASLCVGGGPALATIIERI